MTMKAVPLALCLATSVYGIATANESRHSVIVDMPEVITLTHASPDTWNTLAPVQPNDEPTSTVASAFGAQLVFGQVGRLQQSKCGASSTDLLRNSLSRVELTRTILRVGG
jgi:hypothetical protein